MPPPVDNQLIYHMFDWNSHPNPGKRAHAGLPGKDFSFIRQAHAFSFWHNF
jgi:hypothetical protein